MLAQGRGARFEFAHAPGIGGHPGPPHDRGHDPDTGLYPLSQGEDQVVPAQQHFLRGCLHKSVLDLGIVHLPGDGPGPRFDGFAAHFDDQGLGQVAVAPDQDGFAFLEVGAMAHQDLCHAGDAGVGQGDT